MGINSPHDLQMTLWSQMRALGLSESTIRNLVDVYDPLKLTPEQVAERDPIVVALRLQADASARLEECTRAASSWRASMWTIVESTVSGVAAMGVLTLFGAPSVARWGGAIVASLRPSRFFPCRRYKIDKAPPKP